MSTCIEQGVQMPLKERVIARFQGHQEQISEELQETYSKFGAAVMNEDPDAIKKNANKCKRLEGYQSAIELAVRILEEELV